jgi:hypothetical protein
LSLESERIFLTTNAISVQLHQQQQTQGKSRHHPIPCLDRGHPGHVEKKVITIADLNKAINLTKKISSGGQAGTSGSKLPPNPVITKLLALVDELRQGGILPTAQSSSLTKTEATHDQKVSRRQRKLEAKAKRESDSKKYVQLYKDLHGYSPTLKPGYVKVDGEIRKLDAKDSENSGRVENEELLGMSDDEAPQEDTPLNLSADADLMDFSDDPVPGVVPPNPVGALTKTIKQVAR